MKSPELILHGLVAGLLTFIGVSILFVGGTIEVKMAYFALVGAWVGSLGSLARDMIAPAPNPPVPASVAAMIFGATGIEIEPAAANSIWRPNVLVIFGAVTLLLVVIAVLMLMFTTLESTLWLAFFGLVGAHITGSAAIARDMVQPEPDPAVPASVILAYLDRPGGGP